MWWCANEDHATEPRCVRGVPWARSQPGLGSLWRRYCAAGNHSATAACAASAGHDDDDGGGRRGRHGSLPHRTVLKVMVVLLAIGIAVGWKLRQWQGGKAAVRSSRHEVLQIAFPGATARRRPAKAVAAAPRAPAAPEPRLTA